MATAMGAQLARRLADPSSEFAMPITGMKPIRFHSTVEAWRTRRHHAWSAERFSRHMSLPCPEDLMCRGVGSIFGVELAQPVQVDDDIVALVDRQRGTRGEFIARVEIRDLGMQVVHRAFEHFLRHPFGVR